MKATAITVHRLIQGSKVFLIPTFQRRYTWRLEQWQQLWGDLLAEYALEHPEDHDALYGHFLGSVVLHPAPGPASTLMRHQVIDGQQRLTTILVLLAALRDVRKAVEPDWNASSVDDQYLRNPFSDDYPERLVPTKLDREAYERTIRRQDPTGDIGMAYNFFVAAMKKALEAGEVDLARLGDTLLLHMLMVEITTKTGDSVNSIFNTLNSKGLDLSPADLVRNEVLHHIGEPAADEAHAKWWIPMETALVRPRSKTPDREFVTFLWAREVAVNPKTTRDDLFSVFEKRLRADLQGLSPDDRCAQAMATLEEIFHDHKLFLVVREPTRGTEDQRISEQLLTALGMLRDWRSEPTTPIALWLLKESVAGNVDQADATNAVQVLLSYLTKRILYGVPTNQLNRLLTPIAHELSLRESGESVTERMRALLSKPGYHWPSDEQVRAAVATNPIYASARRYVKFFLSIAEERLPGKESADLSRSQIDHIMPQKLSSAWRDYLTEAEVDLVEAEALTHTLGNLTLTDNNQKMGNATFEEKVRDFFADSALRLNRALAEQPSFLPSDIKDRSQRLAELILAAFPEQAAIGASDESDESGASLRDRLESLLQTLPVGSWVTEDDLVAVLGATDDDLQRIVRALDPTLARLIRVADEDKSIPAWYGSTLREAVAAQDAAQFDLDNRMSSFELTELLAESDDLQTEDDSDDEPN